jgi:hypothetical protein
MVKMGGTSLGPLIHTLQHWAIAMSTDSPSGLPPLENSLSASSGLGSLAQSARKKQLKTARWIMIGVGLLTVVVNGFQYSLINRQIEEEIQKQSTALRARGMQPDQKSVDEFRQRVSLIARYIIGSAIVLGVVFVILGILVYTYPVPATVLGLVLYIGAAAVFGVLAPETLVQGLIIKIIIIVALAKSIQAAVAYQRG